MNETAWKTKKTVPGAALTHPQELLDAIKTKSYLYISGRPQHPHFYGCMMLGWVLERLRRGEIRWAMDAEEPTKYYRAAVSTAPTTEGRFARG